MPEPPAFLRIFEGKALAKALTDAGYQLSEATAQRWIRGATAPKPQDIRAIRELVGAMLPDTTKAAPPWWAERLLAGVMALEKANNITDADVAAARAQAMALVRQIAASNPSKPRRSGGGASGAQTS